MTATMTTAEWLEAMDQHYLGGYVDAGGSSVKFAVCFEGTQPRNVVAELGERSRRLGYLTVDVDAATTKVHFIEQLLARVSDQVPWTELTDRILADFARENHWLVPEAFSPGEGVVAQLDRENGLGEQQISLELQRTIGRRVLQDRSLAKDFRVAMTWLLRARLGGGPEGETINQHITDWLGGRIRAVSELRQYQIFTKVNRANARHLLGSLLEWVRRAGRPGVVVMVDAGRLLEKQRATDGSINYTKAALLDAYEVFRQCIDSTDEFDGLLLCVFVPPAFLDIESRGRGLGAYPALMGRVYDDVRDRNLANPLAALIRLADDGESPSEVSDEELARWLEEGAP